MTQPTNPIYFGCARESGHYFFDPDHYVCGGTGLRVSPPKDFPWGYEVDGKLQPHPGYKQGQVKLHHKDGWTLIAWWDMTVDKRPASCSAFAVDGKGFEYAFTEMVQFLKENFPQVAERQTVDLYL